MYPEMLHDRKIRKLNEHEQLFFMKLLLLAGQEDQEGVLPDVEDIALDLYTKESDVTKTCNKLITSGLLSETEDGHMCVTNFKKRQDTNLTGAEKVARYRERQRVTKENNQSEEKKVTHVTASGYTCNEKVTPDIDKEIDIDKEKDKEEEKSIKRASKKSETKKAYGSHQNVLLTDDEYRKLCERFPDADGKIEALSLGIASKGYKYKDHYATILNWARMDAEKTPQSKPPETTFGDICGFFEASEPEWDIEI